MNLDLPSHLDIRIRARSLEVASMACCLDSLVRGMQRLESTACCYDAGGRMLDDDGPLSAWGWGWAPSSSSFLLMVNYASLSIPLNLGDIYLSPRTSLRNVFWTCARFAVHRKLTKLRKTTRSVEKHTRWRISRSRE